MDSGKGKRKRARQSSGVVTLQRVDVHKKEQSRRLRRESTPAERRLWEYLRNRGVGGLKFRRQQIIEGFIADFYCEEAMLVIEVDGAVHDCPEQKRLDEYRERVFSARGVATLRLSNDAVFTDIQRCLLEITTAASSRVPPSQALLQEERGGRRPG